MPLILLVRHVFIAFILFWIINLNGSDRSPQTQPKVWPEQLNEDILRPTKVGKNIHSSHGYFPQVYVEGYHPIGPHGYGPENYHRPNKYGFGMVPMNGFSDPCHTHRISIDTTHGSHTNAGRTKQCYGLCVGQYGFRKTGICIPALGCRCFSHKLKPKLWIQELMYSPTVAPGMYYRSTEKKFNEKKDKEPIKSEKVDKPN